MCLGSNIEAMLLILLMFVGAQSYGSQIPKYIYHDRNIILQMKNDLAATCNFPPLDVLNNPSEVPFINSCDRPAPEKPNMAYFDEDLFLCMGFYDVALRICEAQHDGLLDDKLPQNTTSFNALLNSFSKNDNFNSSLFCKNLSDIPTSEYSQTVDWVSILKKKLQNEKKCENICIDVDDNIHPICNILVWANTLLKGSPKTGKMNSAAHHTGTPSNVDDKGMNKSQGRHDDVPMDPVIVQETLAVGEAPAVPASVNTSPKETDSALVGQSKKQMGSATINASQKPTNVPTVEGSTPMDTADVLHHLIPSVITDAPLKLPPVAHYLHKPINSVASAAPLSKDNEQKKVLDKEHKVTEGSKPVPEVAMKSLNETSTGTNSPNLPTEHVEIKDSTGSGEPERSKPDAVNHNGNGGGVNDNPDPVPTEDDSNLDSRKPVQNNHKSNDIHTGTERQEEHKAGQNVGEVVDITSSQSPSSSTISPNLPPEQPTPEGKLKGSIMQNEGKTTATSKGQDDPGNEADANLDNLPIDPDMDSEEPGMTSLQDHAYDGDGTPEGAHPVDYDVETKKLPAESSRGTEAYVEDKFVDAEDSNFFTYFMAMIFLCIIGYLVFHNKQKILALAVEGRSRKNSRRRPNTSGYRKLDSNLEEAVTSPCSTSVTHVIY